MTTNIYTVAIAFAMTTFLNVLRDNYHPLAFYTGVSAQTALIACLLVRVVIFKFALTGQLVGTSARRQAIATTLEKAVKQLEIRLNHSVKNEILTNALSVLNKVLAQDASDTVPAPLADLVHPGAPTPEGLGAAPGELLAYLMGPDRALEAHAQFPRRPLAPFCGGDLATGKSSRRNRRGSPGPSPLGSPPLTARQLERDQYDLSLSRSYVNVHFIQPCGISSKIVTPAKITPNKTLRPMTFDTHVRHQQHKPPIIDAYEPPVAYYDDFSFAFDNDALKDKETESPIAVKSSKPSKVSKFFSRIGRVFHIVPKRRKYNQQATQSTSMSSSRSSSPFSESSNVDDVDPFQRFPRHS